MAPERRTTRSMSMAPSEVPSEAPTDAPSEASTMTRAASELQSLQIDDKKKRKKNGTAGSAVAARDAAYRAAASGGVSTRAGRARANTPLFALPMDPVRRTPTTASTAASTTDSAATVRPREGVSTRAATARAGAPLAMLPMAPPRRPSTATATARPRLSIMEAYERRQSELAANAAAQAQVPQSNLATNAAQAMVRRAVANGRVSLTPAAYGGEGVSGSGLGDGDSDVVMGDDDEAEDEDEEEQAQEEESDPGFLHGTRLTAAQLSGVEPRPPVKYWGRVRPDVRSFRGLPRQVYSLPTAAQLERITYNYYKYIPLTKMTYDRINQCWMAIRDWLQQTRLWDGKTVRPEVHYDDLVRLSGVKNSRTSARGTRHCDRCVALRGSSCGLEQDDACETCIKNQWPCTFTDVDGHTTYQNGTGSLSNMLAGHSVTRGFAGQQLVTFHLPQPLEPWLPPTNLPAEPGTPGHRSEQASVPRRGRIGRASPKPRPAPPVAAPPPPRPPPPPPPRPTATWADDEYGFSELSGSEDSGNLENEDKEVNSLTSGQGKQVKRVTWFSMRATSALPPAFFPVLSKRQMHKILVWWSQTHSQGGRPYTIHRRLYLAYTEWALHHGWYDPARSRFEMHFNVLCATMGIGRRQRVSTTCDRCVAHHAEGRCDADNVNACLVCLKAEAPCTRTNLDATRTHYLNGTANVPPGSDLRVTPAGQNVSYVNMRVPRQLIIDLFPPGTAGKYLKATSAPAPPPAPPRAPPRPFAQAGLPLGYMPGQPWQSALPQRQVPPKQPRRLQPAIPQQQAPPEPPQLVAGVGQTGGSMHEQLNAWGAHQLHWNRQHRESQQRQTALRGALFALGINPDVDSRLLPLPPVLPQLDPIANAQLQAQQERARFEQCEAENVRLREVIDATTRARAGSTLPIDPALTQQSPFAQQPRAQQPSVQQTPHQQTSQAGAAAANPFAPMSLDARAGQPQSLTDNVNQGNNAPPRRQRNTLTLGRTRLHSPTRRRAVGQQTTSQATAGQAATTQAPTGPTGPTSTNPRTRASGGGPLAPRLTTAARVTKPKDRQQDTSGTNRPSMKELKQRRKELKAMQASGELDDENTDIPEDLSLLWGIYAPTGEQVSSGSEDEGGDEDNIAGPGAGTGNSANPAPISNVTVQNPGVVGGTGTGSGTAETTTQQANVNPQMVPYPDMDAAIANYLQNEFDSGDGSFMNMLEDDAAMMLDYNPNMGVHGNVDSVAGQQQPDQGEDFDLEDWVNS